VSSPVQTQFKLAKIWHAKGNLAAAMLGYRETLRLEPGHLDAALHLGVLLAQNQRYTEALEIYRQALRHHPGEPSLLRQIDEVALFHEPPEPLDAGDRVALDFPAIGPVSGGGSRPFWSVMLTVYRRTNYLEQALRSVLTQRIPADEMEIEVVADGPDHPAQEELAAIVRSTAGARVKFYRHPERAGHPGIFNVCLQRARGHWIHLLHDDDWVAEGFYEALRRGTAEEPGIGAAFCRHTYVDEEGRANRLSPLERETPGAMETWLERIATFCRLQPPAIVVRRDAYERLGGYCPKAKSVLDWEMWQRLAVPYRVWYEPRPLAFFRESRSSESARLVASGEQIAETRAVIDLAQSYLPDPERAKLAWRAREHYALAAIELARRQMEAGDTPGALANIREAMRCSQSSGVKRKLGGLFLQRV
jgi:tetratricopeptide (TPR) repeat protein